MIINDKCDSTGLFLHNFNSCKAMFHDMVLTGCFVSFLLVYFLVWPQTSESLQKEKRSQIFSGKPNCQSRNI